MLHEIKHPISDAALTILRAEDTCTTAFRQQTQRVALMVLAECLRTLPVDAVRVVTPVGEADGCRLLGRLVVVPVLRAGLAFTSAVEQLCPDAELMFAGLARDETTAEADWYMDRIGDLSGAFVVVLDPMLATGGSATQVIQRCFLRGATTIVLGCIVAAPEGVADVEAQFPNVRIVTAALDSHLNDVKYIIPGLGDFGDRWSGT
ncbi:MAG: Uracil phosphoribosyltransferase [Armatimonadota bacterium]|jgi:uracil phosphoribosyltransferase